jgi:hypothetical protein
MMTFHYSPAFTKPSEDTFYATADQRTSLAHHAMGVINWHNDFLQLESKPGCNRSSRQHMQRGTAAKLRSEEAGSV